MTGSIDAYDIIKYNGMMSYKDKSRMFFFDKLIESHHSSWKCAKDTYERKGRLTLSGLTQIVRDNVSSKSLEKLAEENYKGDQEKASIFLSTSILILACIGFFVIFISPIIASFFVTTFEFSSLTTTT